MAHSLLISSSDRTASLCARAFSISAEGIPVFLTDCGADASGLARIPLYEGTLEPTYPVTFWDIDAKQGLPLRTTVSELGPYLLGGLLDLDEAQRSLLETYIRIADDNDLLLIDTKDLKALISECMENSETYAEAYGPISRQAASALLRRIGALEAKGAKDYLYEPAIDVKDYLGLDDNGFGRIHILDMQTLTTNSRVSTAFLLYILSDLAENLPETNEPRLAVMIDEAGVILQDVDPDRLCTLLDRLSVRGVQVLFAAENVEDIPEAIRVKLETEAKMPSQDIPEPLSEPERQASIAADPLHEKYKIPFERDSAYEFLKRRGIGAAEAAADTGAAGSAAVDADSSASTGAAGSVSSDAADASAESAEDGTEAEADQETASSETAEAASSESKEKKDTSAMAKRAKSSAQSLGNTVAGTVGRKLGKTIGSNFGSFGETLGANIGASLGRGIMNTFFNGD